MIAASETLFPSVSDIPVRNTSELPSETFRRTSETVRNSVSLCRVRNCPGGLYRPPDSDARRRKKTTPNLAHIKRYAL